MLFWEVSGFCVLQMVCADLNMNPSIHSKGLYVCRTRLVDINTSQTPRVVQREVRWHQLGSAVQTLWLQGHSSDSDHVLSLPSRDLVYKRENTGDLK